MRALFLVFLVPLSLSCVAETLRPSSLAKNESISIDCAHDEDRSGYRCVYEIAGGDQTRMGIFECYHYGYGEDTRKMPPKKTPLGELAVKKEDAAGLDRLFEFYRLKTPGDSTTTDRIKIEYYRDGKKIGNEEFLDQSGVANIADGFRQEGDEFLQQNSRGVDIELLKSLAPLYRFNKYLRKNEENQSPVPTATSVTPAAGAPVAPAAAAAQL